MARCPVAGVPHEHIRLDCCGAVDARSESCKWLKILIDGRCFIDLVQEAELPRATRDGYPDLHCTYEWFRPFGWVVHRELGVAELSNELVKTSWFLSCGCEVSGCKVLSGELSRRDGAVVWQHFQNDNRRPGAGCWRLDNLGPFVLNLEQSQAEIAIIVIQDG